MSKPGRCFIPSFLCASLVLAGAAHADDDRRHEDGAVRGGTWAGHPFGEVRLRFTVAERQMPRLYANGQRHASDRDRARDADNEGVREHGHHGRSGGLPPGLQKKHARGEPLPAGWQRKIARGEVMTPAVYASGSPLPRDGRRQLPTDLPGTVTIEVGGEVVRVYEATRDIIDVLR